MLDYDLCRVIQRLQELVTISLRWEKVDSRITNIVYKTGVKPKGNKFAIHLNKTVDKWAEQARETMVMSSSVQDKLFFYPESGVVVRMADSSYIYGNIGRAATEAVSQVPMFKYLQGGIDTGQRIY